MDFMTQHCPNNHNGHERKDVARAVAHEQLHPSWRVLIEYCQHLQHGEIEKLKIQNGLPIIAEVTRKKVKFTP